MSRHVPSPPRFAPVAPPHILKDLFNFDSRQLFGGYHLWLAHLTVERKVEFEELLQMTHYNPKTIIMDNSIVELGESQSCELVAEAIELCQDRGSLTLIPVLPDVMGDGPETIKLVKANIANWRLKVKHPQGFMLVAQGMNAIQYMRLLDYFFIEHKVDYPDITWVGVPRVLQLLNGSRAAAINYVHTVAPHVHVHLLGFSDNILDDIRCAQIPGVHGIDSAVPVRLDQVLIPTMSPQIIGKRGDWMEKGVLTGHNMNNIRNVRKWIGQKAP